MPEGEITAAATHKRCCTTPREQAPRRKPSRARGRRAPGACRSLLIPRFAAMERGENTVPDDPVRAAYVVHGQGLYSPVNSENELPARTSASGPGESDGLYFSVNSHAGDVALTRRDPCKRGRRRARRAPPGGGGGGGGTPSTKIRDDRQQQVRAVRAAHMERHLSAEHLAWPVVGIGMGHAAGSAGGVMEFLAEMGDFAGVPIILAAQRERQGPARRHHDATRDDLHVAFVDFAGCKRLDP